MQLYCKIDAKCGAKDCCQDPTVSRFVQFSHLIIAISELIYRHLAMQNSNPHLVLPQAQTLSQRLRGRSTSEYSKPHPAHHHHHNHNRASLPALSSPNRSASLNSLPLAGSSSVKDVYTRLSAVSESVNSSGLFADLVAPPRPLPLCVRCSSTPSLCMKCAELECENTLTFYRKTRAAGAATLFTKAFVEAGYSKLLKFVVFRLLKNSCQARNRVRMKKRTVVEKLFGANLVYLPFTAWRRYTKENIVSRKDRSIETLNERVAILEQQLQQLTLQNRDHRLEIDALKEESAKKSALITQSNENNLALEAQLQIEQERVRSLSALTVPLEAFCQALDANIAQQIAVTNHELHQAATQITSYNHADVFDQKVLKAVKEVYIERQPTPGRFRLRSVPTRAFFATAQCLTLWVNSFSKGAGDRIEPTTSKTLNMFLPPHSEIEELTELRNGKVLTRVILAILIDRVALEREKSGAQVSSSSKHLRYGSWTYPAVTYEDIECIPSKEAHAMELLSHILTLATKHLEIKAFQPAEIFAGQKEIVLHLLVSLMNASVPSVRKHDHTNIERSIGAYYQLVESLQDTQTKKTSLNTIQKIVDNIFTIHRRPTMASARTKVSTTFRIRQTINFGPNPNLPKIVEAVTATEASNDTDGGMNGFLPSEIDTSSSMVNNTNTSAGNEYEGDNDDEFKPAIEITEETAAAIVALEMLNNEVEKKKQVDVAWDRENYRRLGELVDDMTAGKDHLSFAAYVEELLDAHQAITELRGKVLDERNRRDEGIRYTTDIRQFIFTHFMRMTDPRLSNED